MSKPLPMKIEPVDLWEWKFYLAQIAFVDLLVKSERLSLGSLDTKQARELLGLIDTHESELKTFIAKRDAKLKYLKNTYRFDPDKGHKFTDEGEIKR